MLKTRRRKCARGHAGQAALPTIMVIIHSPAIRNISCVDSLTLCVVRYRPCVFAPNCPQAAKIVCPILKRIVVSMPDLLMASQNRSILSVPLPLNLQPGCGLYSIRLTLHLNRRSNLASRSASSRESLSPFIITYSNVTRSLARN